MACHRAGREAGSVTLVAVSKTFPAESVVEAAANGLVHFGENRIQEAEPKIKRVAKLSAIEKSSPESQPTWHLIGHLQSNKAGKAAELFDLIHTIDSSSLADAVARRARSLHKRQRVLLQVNCTREPQKNGCSPEEASEIAKAISTHPELSLEGLMTIGPLTENPELSRPAFHQCRALCDEIAKRLNLNLPILSMGMTNDLEVAIEEGATIIRIGSALFNHRPGP